MLREWGVREMKKDEPPSDELMKEKRKCLYVRLVVFVAAVFLIELDVGILFSWSHKFGKLFWNVIDRKLSITNPHHGNVSFRIVVRANLFHVTCESNQITQNKI